MAWPLSDKERLQYLSWVLRNKVPLSNDYNMEGFWKAQQAGDPRVSAGINPNDNQMHFTDMFKLPNHPSFSSESAYATPDAPQWRGGLLPGGGESWSLWDKDGNLVTSEAPWRTRGLLGGGE